MDPAGTPTPWGGAPPATGTTIVAVAFDGGVVVGADSRVSTGTYVSNRASDKLTVLDAEGSVWLLRSGSAADTQAVGDYVRYFVDQLASELGTTPSVSAVAHLVKKMNYSNKEALLGAMLVGGWDAERGGQVYGIPIGGSMVRLPWATDGSGSTYIWGFLDAEYKPGLDRARAEKLVATALALAISIDGSSGGMARLVTITAAGAERKLIRGDEVEQFWDSVEPGKQGGEGMVVV